MASTKLIYVRPLLFVDGQGVFRLHPVYYAVLHVNTTGCTQIGVLSMYQISFKIL